MSQHTTEKLSLPYLASNQAQKHVTVNEALRRLDGLVQIALASRGENTPPDAPLSGETHLVGPEPVGAWSGQPGRLAQFADGSWIFHTPQPGFVAFDLDSEQAIVFQDGSWRALTQPFDSFELGALGVGAPALPDLPLVISGDGTLLTHMGDDHRLYINRSSHQDTASLLWQTDYIAGAELGLFDQDALRFRVTGNGLSWSADALVINLTSGHVGINTPNPAYRFDVSGDARVAGILRLERFAPKIELWETGAAVDFFSMVMDNGNLSFRLANDWPGIMTIFGEQRQVGIGVANATATLHVGGTLRLSGMPQAELPAPGSAGAGTLAWVTDRPGGAGLMVSDGNEWQAL